jgi:hypothetical protein
MLFTLPLNKEFAGLAIGQQLAVGHIVPENLLKNQMLVGLVA